MLLLATEAGELIKFDPDNGMHELLFKSHANDAFMGIAEHEDALFLASLDKIYKLNMQTWHVDEETISYSPSPDFHQMQIYDNKLYATITKRNQIWVYNLSLNLLDSFNIASPFPDKQVEYKKNYNHINNIIKRDNKFYVNLNWFTSTPYAGSGVAVLDEHFKPVERYEFGWETHDFQFIDDDMVALCASSSKRKKIMHPYKAGLIVNNELVFEHDPDYAFCKGLAYDENYLYLCGGRKKTRLLRRFAGGVIYKLNRKDYRLAAIIEPAGIKAIKGCLKID